MLIDNLDDLIENVKIKPLTDEEILSIIRATPGCRKCAIIDLSAKQEGYGGGMCKECYHKQYVTVKNEE